MMHLIYELTWCRWFGHKREESMWIVGLDREGRKCKMPFCSRCYSYLGTGELLDTIQPTAYADAIRRRGAP